MSEADKLIAKGADIVGGDLILRHKVVGMFRSGSFILTPEGQAELEITDVVEVREVRKPRAKKAEAVEDQITDSVTIALDGEAPAQA